MTYWFIGITGRVETHMGVVYEHIKHKKNSSTVQIGGEISRVVKRCRRVHPLPSVKDTPSTSTRGGGGNSLSGYYHK